MITDRVSNGGCDPSTFDATLITSYKFRLVKPDVESLRSRSPQWIVWAATASESMSTCRRSEWWISSFSLSFSAPPYFRHSSVFLPSLTLHHLSTYDICRHSRIPRRLHSARRAVTAPKGKSACWLWALGPAKAGKTGREKSGKRMIRNCSTSTINGRRDYDITEIDITESDVAEFDITENDITESDITETNITWIGKLL